MNHMYAMPPACGCSCFAVSDGGSILFGQNSDFLTALEDFCMNVIYRFPSGAFSFTGNTTAYVEMEDGVNEHGLAVGLTSVYPRSARPGLNAGILTRLLPETCRTTGEAVRLLERLPVSSSQTLTIADKNSGIAVVECCPERLSVIWPSEERPFVCAANRFHSEGMTDCGNPAPDDWYAEERYRTLQNSLGGKARGMNPEVAMELLSGRDGFLCQYDRKIGRDTVWSVVCDLKSKTLYRAEGNPAKTRFERDERFTF